MEMKKYKFISANEYCVRVFDGTHDSPKPCEKGYKLLTSKNILDGELEKTSAYYISEKDYNAINQRSKVQKYDVLFSMIGSVGNVCLIKDDNIDFAIKNMGVLSCKDKEKALFLYYYLQSPFAKKMIDSYLNGAVQKFLGLERLRNFPILEYSTDKQKIAAVLSSLDDKIALNKRINAKLEAMAKRLYDYWFVQFDFPNEEGKPYKTSGGKMVWNEVLKRKIPEGWEVGNLYEIADYINGLACQNYRPQDEEIFLPVIKIKEMHEGITSDTEKVSATIPEKYIIFDGDILFSWSATLEVMIWTGGKGGLNQHIFKVVPKSYFTKEYVFQQLSSYIVNFQKMAEARKTTMGHITSDHIYQSRIVIPPKEVINAFSEKTLPIFNYQLTIQKEIQKLTALRDRLLPLLMNGQVEVEG